MRKDNNLDEWLDYWQKKIAVAWRMGRHEEEEWLRLQMETYLKAPQKPHIERSDRNAPNHTAEEE